MSADAPVTPLADALADVRIRAPTRGNRRLERLLDAANADPQVNAWWPAAGNNTHRPPERLVGAANADPQVKALWHVAGINAQRLEMADHSWVHIQIVTNIALRLARLLSRAGIVGSMGRHPRMT